MDGNMKGGWTANRSEDEMGIRKGPWTGEEDTILTNYIATHGEGRWNSVARSAGLKRTGKSCRLRWLNYLRPDVRRGNITLQEQILILDLHSRWGNRWSKIAQHLPGRTDNEIKNYWRTRVIKQAKQLKCDVNGKEFRDAVRYVWMPRLLERIRASSEYHPTHQPQKQVDPSGLLHQRGLETEWPNPNHSSSASYSATDHSESSDITVHPEGNGSDTQMSEQGNVIACGDSMDNLWNDENMWFLRQQLCDEI